MYVERLRVSARGAKTNRANPMADIAMRPSLEPDPIAVLARLIGQAGPQGRSAPAENCFHEQTAPDSHDGEPHKTRYPR